MSAQPAKYGKPGAGLSLTAEQPRVLVHVLTFNHQNYIRPCLQAAMRQEGFTLGKDLFIYVTDNASSDSTAAVLQEFRDIPGITIIEEPLNLGFTGAHNKGLAYLNQQQADFLLLLNPDVALSSSCLQLLLRALRSDFSAACAVPKLLRADEHLQALVPATIDAAGMIITPSVRHFDRGAGELDQGQYEQSGYVFGGTGACLLLRRSAIEDCAYTDSKMEPPQRLFADAFFAYREDAELAWRLQRLGWRCRYQADAVAHHVRRVTPERRESLPPLINTLGVQNRFLLQLLHFDLRYWPFFGPCALRNLLVVAACFLKERSSLEGLKSVLRQLPNMLTLRRWLRERERIPAQFIRQWFCPGFQLRPALHWQVNPKRLSSLDVVIINYNSGQRLAACLSSLSQLELKISMRVIVVDNASVDLSGRLAQETYARDSRFHFILSDKNLGFAGGINEAAAQSSADALLILNPDIEVTQEAIEELVEALNAHADLAAVAPLLVDQKEEPQLSFSLRSLPRFGATLAELLLIHRLWPSNPWTMSWRADLDPRILNELEQQQSPSTPRLPVIIEQPPAACFLVRRAVFDRLGGFDTAFWPAWFEDVDFCKRLAENNLLCGIVPRSRVLHEGGYSVSTLSTAEFRRIWFTNLRRYWAKHGSPTQKYIIKLSIPLALQVRRWFSPQKRQQSAPTDTGRDAWQAQSVVDKEPRVAKKI